MTQSDSFAYLSPPEIVQNAALSIRFAAPLKAVALPTIPELVWVSKAPSLTHPQRNGSRPYLNSVRLPADFPCRYKALSRCGSTTSAAPDMGIRRKTKPRSPHPQTAGRCARRSRISVSSFTSSGGGAASASASSFLSSCSRSVFTPLTIRKMIQARIRKLMTTVIKLP